MALKFNCDFCKTELITEWLQVGDSYFCKDCNKRIKIPKDAKQIDGIIKEK